MPHECTDCGRAFADGSKEMLSGCPNCGGTTFQFRPAGTEPTDGADEPPDPPEAEVDGVTRTVGNAASAVRNLVTGDGASTGPPERDQPDPEVSSSDPAAAIGSEESGESVAAAESKEHGESAAATERDEADGSVSAANSGADDGESASGEVTVPSTPEWPGADDAGTESDDAQRNTTPQAGSTQSDTPDDIVEADEIPTATAGQPDRPPVPDPRPLSARPEEGEESGESAESEDSGESTPADTEEGVTAGDSDERPSLSELRAELNNQFESIRVVEPGQYELNLMELYDREEYIVALQEDGKYSIQLPERWDER